MDLLMPGFFFIFSLIISFSNKFLMFSKPMAGYDNMNVEEIAPPKTNNSSNPAKALPSSPG